MKNLTRRITVGLATAARGAFAAAALSAPTVASAGGGGLVDVEDVKIPVNVEVKDVANHLALNAKILS